MIIGLVGSDEDLKTRLACEFAEKQEFGLFTFNLTDALESAAEEDAGISTFRRILYDYETSLVKALSQESSEVIVDCSPLDILALAYMDMGHRLMLQDEALEAIELRRECLALVEKRFNALLMVPSEIDSEIARHPDSLVFDDIYNVFCLGFMNGQISKHTKAFYIPKNASSMKSRIGCVNFALNKTLEVLGAEFNKSAELGITIH